MRGAPSRPRPVLVLIIMVAVPLLAGSVAYWTISRREAGIIRKRQDAERQAMAERKEVEDAKSEARRQEQRDWELRSPPVLDFISTLTRKGTKSQDPRARFLKNANIPCSAEATLGSPDEKSSGPEHSGTMFLGTLTTLTYHITNRRNAIFVCAVWADSPSKQSVFSSVSIDDEYISYFQWSHRR